MFARTSRLLLRPGWPEDAAALRAAIADEGIVRNLATAPWPYALADAEAFLARARDPRLPALLMLKRTRGAPHLVGGCGISAREDGRLELGYWVARPCWGLGFATEAAAAVMGIARAMGLNGVTAGHFIDNPASGRVLRKIGFRPVGRIEPRFSLGRGRAELCRFYEDGAEGEMRDDPAAEIYPDCDSRAA